jgi:pilus assembly protein CpaF
MIRQGSADSDAPDPAPLLALERHVQDRCRGLDVDTSAGSAKLDQIILDEAMSALGRPTASSSDHLAYLVDRCRRDLVGLGPLDPLLADPDVWEIMINGVDQIHVRRHIGRSGLHDEVFHDADHLTRTIARLIDRSSASHRKLEPSEGLQDARLCNGDRLHIVHGDIAEGGTLIVNIRRFTGLPHRRLDALVANGTLTLAAASLLSLAARIPVSVLFSGPPGSGKTTLLGCTAAEIAPGTRVVVAEEVFELDLDLDNVVHLQTRPARGDRAEIDLRQLVAGFLRMSAEVAIVGEVRDREALALLLSLSSGIKGFTTVHAGSPSQALLRLQMLAGADAQLPASILPALIETSFDLVVQCARANGRVMVSEIAAVEPTAVPGRPRVASILRRVSAGSDLQWTGLIPESLAEKAEGLGVDLSRVLDPSRDALAYHAAGRG